jgi:hypothetical protein
MKVNLPKVLQGLRAANKSIEKSGDPSAVSFTKELTSSYDDFRDTLCKLQDGFPAASTLSCDNTFGGQASIDFSEARVCTFMENLLDLV